MYDVAFYLIVIYRILQIRTHTSASLFDWLFINKTWYIQLSHMYCSFSGSFKMENTTQRHRHTACNWCWLPQIQSTQYTYSSSDFCKMSFLLSFFVCPFHTPFSNFVSCLTYFTYSSQESTQEDFSVKFFRVYHEILIESPFADAKLITYVLDT